MQITKVKSPLEYAILAAPDVDATLVNRISDTQAHFEFNILIPDGSRMLVQLLVSISDEEYLVARELVPTLLPASCPQRHINFDGTFCIGWSGVQNMKVLDPDSAGKWWCDVFAFLKKQRRATKSRQWPGEEWAHGHSAAASQLIVEDAAKNLGEDFVTDLKLGKFRVEKIEARKRPSPLLKVFRNDIHIYSVWESFKCLTNSRVPCLCRLSSKRRAKKIKSCSNHRQLLIDFGIHLHLKEVEELKFLKAYCTFNSCCETLDKCPVRDILAVRARVHEIKG